MSSIKNTDMSEKQMESDGNDVGTGYSSKVLGTIDEKEVAFSHVPEHGFSLFLANRTKTIHFIRHAEGTHNEANRAYGDDTPVTYTTEGSWAYLDAKLTSHGIQQCVKARETLLGDAEGSQLIVVSPFTRTLQTAHIMFGGKGIPFMVHDLAKERAGKYTCDKRRTKTEILREIQPIYEYTQDRIDFDSFGYKTEDDLDWHEEREPSSKVTDRAVRFMEWLCTRPEQEIAVVTHSSWLKHLFRAFGKGLAEKDMENLQRLSGNAEVRSICLAMHRGFYPEGEWHGDTFVPNDRTFRRFRYAPNEVDIAQQHDKLPKKHCESD